MGLRTQHSEAGNRPAAAATAGKLGRRRSESAERAIVDATLALLAEGSVSSLTVEGVAARAGVGKTTIYRRWSSKLPLVVEAIRALPELKVPNTGTLRGDLRQILSALVKILRSSPLGPVLQHVAAESWSDPELRDAISEHLALRRAPLVEVTRRALERGELPAGTDPDILTEMVTGPIVNRLLFLTGPVDRRFIDLVIATVLEGTAQVAGKHERRGRSRSRQPCPATERLTAGNGRSMGRQARIARQDEPRQRGTSDV